MTSQSFVQSAFYSSTRKNWFDGIVGIVNGHLIVIEDLCFRGIRFFLLNVVQPISFAEAFQLGTKGKNWNLNKVLVIALTHVAVLFQRWVVSHNNRSNLSTETEVDYVSCSFIKIIIDLVFASIRQPSFFFSQAFNSLFIFVRNKFGSAFVKPLIFRFNPAPINNKRLVSRTDYCSKIVQTKVDRYRFFFKCINLLITRFLTLPVLKRRGF